MNEKFDELAKEMAQPITRTILCLVVAAQCIVSALADDFRRGPVIDLSDPDALAACGSNGVEKECPVAVSPTNPKNVVTAWIGGLFKGIVVATSFDGGKHWQQVVIPGLSSCSGDTLGF